MRRTRQRIAADRAAIVAALPTDGRAVNARDIAVRLGVDEVRPADLTALTAAGAIEREVRQEWDHVYQPHFNGGQRTAMKRHRAYYRLPD